MWKILCVVTIKLIADDQSAGEGFMNLVEIN